MFLAVLSLSLACCYTPTPEELALKARLPDIFAKAAAHYKALAAAATPLMRNAKGKFRIPRSWSPERGLVMHGADDWTCGHYAGALWYLHEATGDGFFRDRAVVWTEILAPNAKRDNTHDLGFMMNCSYGNARRLLKADRYDALLVEAARSLSKRFNPDLGLIRSWGARGDKKAFRVIPDNLMNLELLELAAILTGDAKFDRIARSHADVTMKFHFRPDGGCYHVLDYDQKTLRVKGVERGQGASCETAWARGQSWAVYGYTMMYCVTKDMRYLDFAKRLADFALDNPNMPADGVPCWDYGAPGEERDTSAAAILASALLELSGQVHGRERVKYRTFAVKVLTSLSSDAYFSSGDEIGHFLLKHGVGHKPAGKEIDVPLNYGDYYYLEALLRFRRRCSAKGAADSVKYGKDAK